MNEMDGATLIQKSRSSSAVLPEAEIALCCARTWLDPQARARMAMLLEQPVDWPRLLRIAVRSGVMPLVASHLSADFADAVPPVVLSELRERFRANAARNVMLVGELSRLVTLLERSGIPVITYKGPLLAIAAYGSLALRSFSDLDILIRKQHVLQAKRLLVERGYRPSWALTSAQEAVFLDAQCEYNFVREDRRVWVEVHWEIIPRYFSFRLDPAQLWERSGRMVVAGASFRTLAPEDLFLILCVHGTKHCWERLEWISSLAEIVRRHGGLDWDRIVTQAAERGGSRMLNLSLRLASELMSVALPDSVREGVHGDRVAGLLAHQVSTRLLAGAEGSPSTFEEARFHLLARERRRDRLRYLVRLATTQTLGDWDLLRLPAGLSWLYGMIRPMRLLAKFGPAAVGRLLSVVVSKSRAEGTRL
jgi:hypothetical protein